MQSLELLKQLVAIGVIIPKRRSVTVNNVVSKVSAGATTYVKVARVNNLNETIRKLKDSGLWIIGTDGEAEKYYYDQDFKGPIAIVIGSEGFGMSKLVKENVDLLVKIPMKRKNNFFKRFCINWNCYI